MLGPLFVGELVRTARRRKFHLARWAFGAWLTLGLYFASLPYFVGNSAAAGKVGQAARAHVDNVVAQLMLLLIVAAPTFAAGAVTDEKTRGTFEPLLLASVRPISIVLGKLLARVAYGYVWSLAAWPIIAFIGVPGGVAPVFFACLAAVELFLLLGVCGVSLLVSVWSRHSRSAVIGVYILLAIGAGAVIAAQTTATKASALARLIALDPLYVLDAARDQPDLNIVSRRMGEFMIAWGGIAGVSTLLAAWRLRPAYFRQLESRARPRFVHRFFSRREVADEPVYWKEAFTGRRFPRVIGCAMVAGVTVYYFNDLVQTTLNVHDRLEGMISLHWLVIAGCSVVAGAMASSCITMERDRQTWEGLLATPMEFDQILQQKAAAIQRAVWPYYFAFLITAGLLTSLYANWDELMFRGGPGQEAIIALVAIGAAVALVVAVLGRFGVPLTPIGGWIAAVGVGFLGDGFLFLALLGPILAIASFRFLIAVGLWFSVRSTNTWLALLGTVIVGSMGIALIVGASTPIACMSCCFGTLVAYLLENLLGNLQSFGLTESMGVLCWGAGCSVVVFWASRHVASWTTNYLLRHERVAGGFVRMIDLDLPYKGPRHET